MNYVSSRLLHFTPSLNINSGLNRTHQWQSFNAKLLGGITNNFTVLREVQDLAQRNIVSRRRFGQAAPTPVHSWMTGASPSIRDQNQT